MTKLRKPEIVSQVYDELHGLSHKLEDTDIKGLLDHNTLYVQKFKEKQNVSRFYFEGYGHYGSITNGAELESLFRENRDSAKLILDDIMAPNFALSYAFDCVQPDRIIAIANGAVGYAATSKYFGRDVEFVEGHPHGNNIEGNTGKPNKEPFYHEQLNRPLKDNEKILILEDVSDGGEKTTYGLVRDGLIRNYGIKASNISYFFGHPGHGYHGISNDCRQVDAKEREESLKKFSTLLKLNAFFLPAETLSGQEYLSFQEWPIFVNLTKRKDLDLALERFTNRMKGRT